MKKQFAFLLLIPFISLSSCSFFTKIKSLFNKEEQEEVLEGLTDADNEWIEPNPENFNYVECEGGIKLTKYNFADDTPTIAVPQKINGKNVVGIAKDCFKRKKPLSRPIEENPDYDPNSPTFYIGDNIITVDENSFNFGATFFTSYAEKPESWEDNAISYYSAIDDRGNTYYSTTPKEIFVYKGVVYYEHRVLNAYFVAKCLTKQAEITIVPKIKGKSVITLGSSCFTGNSDLETINLPYTLVDLQAAAFSGCTNLKNINFYESSITILREEAFSSCTLLKEIRLPKNLAKIQYHAFLNCGTIETIYIPASLDKLANEAFYNTTVNEVYYGGTEDMWQELIKGKSKTGLENAVIHYGENIEYHVLDTPSKEFEAIPAGSKVTVTGIISGYSYVYDRLYVTDPETSYTILCYDSVNRIFANLENDIGRKITITGQKSLYLGQPELIKISYTLCGEETYDIGPKIIDWKSNKFEDYVGIYSIITGRIKEYTQTSIMFYEYDGIVLKGINLLPENLVNNVITAHIFVGLYGEYCELSLYAVPIEINS